MPDLYSNVRRANSNYTPQYIGSNTDTIKSVADTLQLRSLQNQNAIDDKLVAAINEQYAPGDEAIGQKIYEDISGMRDQIASSDQGFENSTGLVRNLVRDKFLTNRDRIEGLRNKKQYDIHQEMLRQLGADAVDFTEPFKGTVNEDGTYNRYTPRVEKAQPILKTKEELFDNFHADSIKGNFAVGKGDLADFLVARQTGGISNTKVENYANQALLRYKETPSYKQEQRIYKRDNPNLSNSEIDDKIKTSLIATGAERVFKVSDQDLQRQYQLRSRDGGNENNRSNSSYEETEVKEYKPTLIDRSKLAAPSVTNPLINKSDYIRVGEDSYPATKENLAFYKPLIDQGKALVEEGYVMRGGEVLPKSPETDALFEKMDKAQEAVKVNKYKENYETLSDTDRDKFNRVVQKFNPEAGKEFYKTKEAFDLVNKYFDQVEQTEFNEVTPIITTDYNQVIDENGRTLRDKETANVQANFGSRIFYNPKTGTKLSGSDEKILKTLNKEYDTDFESLEDLKKSIQVRGEFSPKNLFAKVGKAEALVDPLAATLNGKDIAVSRGASERKSPVFQSRKLINDAYTALKELPGISSNVTLGGIDFNIGEFETNNGKVIVLETKDRKKQIKSYIDENPSSPTYKQEIPLTELEDLPKALYQAYRK